MKHPFIQLLILHFDRSFSGKGWKQLMWLTGIISAFFLVIYAASFVFTLNQISAEGVNDGKDIPAMGRFFQLICLFVDPGNINNVPPVSRWFALGVAMLGLILFCGLLISVISNMLERRVERFRSGHIVYRLQKHVVVIGFDDRTNSLIRQICEDPQYNQSYILVQSTQPAEEIRNKIHTEMDAKNEKRVIVLNARRDSMEDLEKLETPYAREIFLVGEKDEHNHDSLNVDCLKKIVEIHKKKKNCPLIPFTVVFEFQTTFAAFQVTDLSSEWRKYIQFRPFNYYEGWAKKMLVARTYGKGENRIEYPALDREPISYESEKQVHVVIIGMNRMGIATGTEAAHLLHFPNFCRDRSKKSIITFIDENADREMNFFRGRYRHYFELSSVHYSEIISNIDGHEPATLLPHTTHHADFLDIQFEFIKGSAETPGIQRQIESWANDPNKLLTLIVCLDFPSRSMAVGLYLPEVVYTKNIPVFIRQDTSGALLTMLNERKKEEASHKYSHIFPFGMQDGCYDLDKESIYKGQAINYIYDYYYKNRKLPDALPSKEELEERWNKLPVAHQWSNLYSAYSIGPKLRSVGLSENNFVRLSDEHILLLAQVEHNRWNMEKLLLGFRKPTAQEENIIQSSKEKREEYKNKYFVHPDICPYEDLPESSKEYDRCITAGIPLLVNKS